MGRRRVCVPEDHHQGVVRPDWAHCPERRRPRGNRRSLRRQGMEREGSVQPTGRRCAPIWLAELCEGREVRATLLVSSAQEDEGQRGRYSRPDAGPPRGGDQGGWSGKRDEGWYTMVACASRRPIEGVHVGGGPRDRT